MSAVAAQFIARLAASGLATATEAEQWLAEASIAGDHDDRQIAAELVRLSRLTGFQAESLLRDPPLKMLIGRYVLLDRIGEGGMGQVFKAHHVRLERLAAIKLLHPHAFDSPESVRRFRQEVKTAGMLRHPNIVLAYDADEAEGRQYLVMEFVDGRDLGQIARERLPSIDEAAAWILQAARGLAHAHEAGVIHRDIKPSNLLLDREGVVKVLDLGIARVESQGKQAGVDETTETQLTQSGVIIGTVDFMSPEQAENLRQADARSDVYSLGCSLFQLLAGRPAFDGATIIEKIIAHRERELPCLRELRPDAPELIEIIVERMMAKHPDDRHQSMAEVIDELEDFLKRSPSSAATLVGPRDAAPGQATAQSPIPVTVRRPAARRHGELQKLIEGCGAVDSFLTVDEEIHVFRVAGERGFTVEEIEEALKRTCEQRGWNRQTTLTATLTNMLCEASKNGAAIDRREFDEAIRFAVQRKMPRRAAQEHCLTLILDHHWAVKEGFFDKWFSRLCRQYGLS